MVAALQSVINEKLEKQTLTSSMTVIYLLTSTFNGLAFCITMPFLILLNKLQNIYALVLGLDDTFS